MRVAAPQALYRNHRITELFLLVLPVIIAVLHSRRENVNM